MSASSKKRVRQPLPPEGHKRRSEALKAYNAGLTEEQRRTRSSRQSVAKLAMYAAMTPDQLQQKNAATGAGIAAAHHRRMALELGQKTLDLVAKYPDLKRVFHNARNHYGITAAQYVEMMEAQGWKCLICFAPFLPFKKDLVHTDHDHETGRFRGILCRGCNIGLSYFEHSPEWLYSALEYLGWRGMGDQ